MTKRRGEFLKELASQMEAPEEKDGMEYEGRAKGFQPVPDEICYVGGFLTPGERLCWLALHRHVWERDPEKAICWPGRERLALMIGVSPRQVTTYLNGLRRKGLLKSRRRQNKTSLYFLFDPPKSAMRKTKALLRELKKRKEAERKAQKEKPFRELLEDSVPVTQMSPQCTQMFPKDES